MKMHFLPQIDSHFELLTTDSKVALVNVLTAPCLVFIIRVEKAIMRCDESPIH